MAGAWVSSYCLNVEGIPIILHATLQKLGVKDCPEYEGHEYEKHGTDRCDVTIYIGKSEEFPNLTESRTSLPCQPAFALSALERLLITEEESAGENKGEGGGKARER